MGFLKKLFGGRAAVQALPAGSLTVDRNGRIVTSTVASAYPRDLIEEISAGVLTLFREARAAQMPLAEASLQFGSLHITARELRGGAVIFLLPQNAPSPAPNHPEP